MISTREFSYSKPDLLHFFLRQHHKKYIFIGIASILLFLAGLIYLTHDEIRAGTFFTAFSLFIPTFLAFRIYRAINSPAMQKILAPRTVRFSTTTLHIECAGAFKIEYELSMLTRVNLTPKGWLLFINNTAHSFVPFDAFQTGHDRLEFEKIISSRLSRP